MAWPCKHKNAYPTIYYNHLGYFWCPDCGAIRKAKTVGTNGVCFDEKHWLRPRGYKQVLKDLEKETIKDE